MYTLDIVCVPSGEGLELRPVYRCILYLTQLLFMSKLSQQCTRVYMSSTGTVREMLGLHPCEIVEVNASQHPDHLVHGNTCA